MVIGGWVLKEKHFARVVGTVLPSLPNSCSVEVPRWSFIPLMPGVKVEAKEENRLESLLHPSLSSGDWADSLVYLETLSLAFNSCCSKIPQRPTLS